MSEYTKEEIEGIENLCRFLCDHQNELHGKIMEAASMIHKGNHIEAGDLLIMNVPIIQGTSNQFNLANIGKQETDMKKVSIGVNALLK